MMLQYVVMIGFGLLALFIGGEWLVKGAARLASSFGVPALVIGMTIVAWATSAPELVVNLQAALGGSSDLALGNVVGSNVVNIGLVLGLIGLFFRTGVDHKLARRELPIMVGTAVLLFLLAMDGSLSQLDGAIMLVGFVGFSFLMVIVARQESKLIERDLEEMIDLRGKRPLEFGRLTAGIVLLILGATLTVDGAVGVARQVGVSELFIGLTLVAVGTSLPEIAASLMAGFRRQTEIAVGNIVGSNIANILGVLGITSLIRPIAVPATLIAFELPMMVGISVLVIVFALWRGIHRLEALALLGTYALFIGFSFAR
jgi:cation:H+ antiporter